MDTPWKRTEAEPSIRDVRVWVDQKVEAILARPEMWGFPETIEVLVLEHLCFRMALTVHPAKVGDACTAIRNAWLRWIVDQNFVNTGCSGLVGALEGLTQGSQYEMVLEALRGFCEAKPWETDR
jgi:hypothetical protein